MRRKLLSRPSLYNSHFRAAGSRLAYVIAIAVTAIGIYSIIAGVFGRSEVPVVNAQTDMFLSRRLDQIEQRFNYLESRVGQIESQARSSSIIPRSVPNSSEQDIQFLRTQLDGMRIRLGEVECALLHVDERTLTPAQRAARRRASQGSSEKCRENAASPVELSARP